MISRLAVRTRLTEEEEEEGAMIHNSGDIFTGSSFAYSVSWRTELSSSSSSSHVVYGFSLL